MTGSMSNLGLLWACPASWAGPPPDEQPGGPAACFGNAIHLGAERATAGEAVDIQACAREERVDARDLPRLARVWAHAAAWIMKHRQVGWRAEVAYAVDPLTRRARELGTRIRRDYAGHGLKPHELPGTVDIVTMAGDSVVVFDWKTGKSHPEHYRLQMLGLALAAAKTYGVKRARAVVLKVTEHGVEEHPVLADDDRDELDVMDLEAFAFELSQHMAEIPTARPRGGAWCAELYCPHRKTCAEAA